MDHSEPGWHLYRTLLAVLEEGSLSGGARALGLTQPTAGRHIEMLEASLGVALFTRSQSGLAPTEAALTIKPYAESLRSTTEALRRRANSARDAMQGTVRITAAEIVGAEILPSILVDIRRQHPRLALELALSDRTQDLLQRDADIAVRMVQPTQDALVARKIGVIELGLFAHPDYLHTHPAPTDIATLGDHDLIGFDRENAYIRRVLSTGLPIRRSMFALRTDSSIAQLASLRAGFGIGFCHLGLAAREPRLTRVLTAMKLELETWVVMHEDMRSNRACRAVFDGLADGLTAYIEGAAKD